MRGDALSRFGSLVEGIKERKITVMVKSQPIIDEAEVHVVEMADSWKTPFVRYLKYGELPSDAIAAKRLQFKANRFSLVGDDLYKRTPEGILLKCLDAERSQYVMKEIHEGSCGNHSGGRSLAQKILRQATPLEPLKVACPFDQWGIDIIGPFPQAVAQKKFLIVAVEYFFKWVEAEALARSLRKRLDWKEQKGHGSKNCLEYFGHTEQPRKLPQVRPLSVWCMAVKLSYLRRLVKKQLESPNMKQKEILRNEHLT
ncbi:UNVERIFIED_CONTAM: hypothetical protein Sindi_0073100 [Sesamum indicum]